MTAHRTACPQLKATDLADRYGFTARYWIKLAAAGRVPGAWQPSGPGGAWLFDEAQFAAWREATKRKVTTWPGYIAEVAPIGAAPSVRAENTGAASRRQIEQSLKSVLGLGSKTSKRLPGAKSRGAHSRRPQIVSSVST